MRNHLRATHKFLTFPSPRNFFEHIKSVPGQRSIDRYVMTHDWAYKTGYVIAVVTSSWVGGYGGAVYQSCYTYLNTSSTTEAVKAGAKAAAMQYLLNAVVSQCSVCTRSTPAVSAGEPYLIVFADAAKAGVASQGSVLAAQAASAALFAPTGPDGRSSTVGGTPVRSGYDSYLWFRARAALDPGVNPAKMAAAFANAANAGRLAASGTTKLIAATGMAGTGVGAAPSAPLAAWGLWNINSSRSALMRSERLFGESLNESLYDASWRNALGVLPFGDRYDDPGEPTMGEFFRTQVTGHTWYEILTNLGELSL